MANHLLTLPLFQPLKGRTTFNVSGEPERDRHDIAYLTNSLKKYYYLSMSYRFLPEIVDVIYVMPVLMTKHPYYDRLFKMAFLRVVQAGALEMKRKNDAQKQSRCRIRLEQGDQRKPISLRNFRAVFVVWSIGCGIALCVFAFEYRLGYL